MKYTIAIAAFGVASVAGRESSLRTIKEEGSQKNKQWSDKRNLQYLPAWATIPAGAPAPAPQTWTPCTTLPYYPDKDHDGFGDAHGSPHYRCAPGSGGPNPQPNWSPPAWVGTVHEVSNNLDCNDNDALTYPSAREICNDGIANDCGFDTSKDQDYTTCACRSVDPPTALNPPWKPPTFYYPDRDSDGFGDSRTGQAFLACTPPTGPFTYVLIGGDCEDLNPGVHPNATEICNTGISEKCAETALIDDPLKCQCTVTGKTVKTTWYKDGDSDGYGLTDTRAASCGASATTGETPLATGPWSKLSGDCNDALSSISPAAIEICADSIDNNCNGEVDELACGCTTAGQMPVEYFTDNDGDGYYNSTQKANYCSVPTNACAYSGSPLAATTAPCITTKDAANGGDDCNDSSAAVHPGSKEICGDNIDNNCDGDIDDALDCRTDGTCAEADLHFCNCLTPQTISF